MRATKIIYIILLLICQVSFAKTYQIVTSGTSFSPNNLVIEVGDEVKFVLGSTHDAVEVSKETYESNESTSNGGFSFPLGGSGTKFFSKEGTSYFVCTPHVKKGMKGTIIVKAKIAADLTEVTGNSPQVDLYPNPAKGFVNISFFMLKSGYTKFTVFDITGRNVFTSNKLYFQDGPQNYYLDFKDAIKAGKYVLKCEYNEIEQSKILIVK